MDTFSYSHYRHFLKDWLEKAKKEKRFTASDIASQLRIHRTFLSQVLTGKKDFSAEHWNMITEQFDLPEIEKDFLHFLFLKNRSGTTHLKNYYQKKMDEILKRKLQLRERMTSYRELSDTDRAIFYSSWLYISIWAFSGIGKGQSLDSIAKAFSLAQQETQKILDFLLQTGICKLEKNLVVPGEMHIHVPAGSPFVNKHHMNWRVQALQSLDQTTDEHLHFTAPMTISRKDFHVIRENIVRLIQKTVEVAKASPAEELAALNIDFFLPLD